MTKWLEDFSYETTISRIIFPAIGLITLLPAVLTVSVHAVRAAMANPVKYSVLNKVRMIESMKESQKMAYH